MPGRSNPSRAGISPLARLRRIAGTIRQTLRNPRTRSEWLTRLRAGRLLHQDTSLTWPDRYPKLFGAVERATGDHCQAILSFGCSSGEEVATLRQYFSETRLVGAELNRTLLAQCRQLSIPGDVRFIYSENSAIADAGPYDAIFCMAVFQRRPHFVEESGITDISSHYPFALFASQLAFLVGQLRMGGLIVVEHSHYCVENLQEALGLEPVAGEGTGLARGSRFTPDGKRIEPQPVVDRVFRRTAHGSPEQR